MAGPPSRPLALGVWVRFSVGSWRDLTLFFAFRGLRSGYVLDALNRILRCVTLAGQPVSQPSHFRCCRHITFHQVLSTPPCLKWCGQSCRSGKIYPIIILTFRAGKSIIIFTVSEIFLMVSSRIDKSLWKPLRALWFNRKFAGESIWESSESRLRPFCQTRFLIFGYFEN